MSCLSIEDKPAMQTTLEWNFIAEVDPEIIARLTSNSTNRDVCLWELRDPPSTTYRFCTTCDDGIWTELHVHQVTSRFHPEFLPNSIRSLKIMNSRQEYEYDMRNLPAQSENVLLVYNLLYGSLNLTVLPSGLKIMSVAHNKLSGSIIFTNLPARLELINLTMNSFQQDVVYYANLPRDLRTIGVVLCRIKSAQSLSGDPEDLRIAKEAFLGIESIR